MDKEKVKEFNRRRIVIHQYNNTEDLQNLQGHGLQPYDVRRALIYSWLIKILGPNETFAQQEIVNALCYGRGEGDQESKNKVFVEFKDGDLPQYLISKFRRLKHPESFELVGVGRGKKKKKVEDPRPPPNIVRDLGGMMNEEIKDNRIVIINHREIEIIRLMQPKQRKEKIYRDLSMMDTENYQIEREYIKTVTVTNPKDQRNKGVIIVKFHEKNKDITTNYVNVLKKDDSRGLVFGDGFGVDDLPFENIVEYTTKPEIIEKKRLSQIVGEKPEESANMIREFGYQKDHQIWRELTERDQAQRLKEVYQSRKRSTRGSQKSNENQAPRGSVDDDTNNKGPKHHKRRSTQQKRQIDSFAETVTNKINTHNQTEEYVKNSLFDIFKHASKYRKGLKFISLRDWAVKNICHNAKRIIILMHLGKLRGYEWNAHDLNINVLWQRQWEESLELTDDDIPEAIRISESFTQALKRLHCIMNVNSDKCVLSLSEDIMSEVFAATQISTPTIASIISAKYEEIKENFELRAGNFPMERRSGVCTELDTVMAMEGWEKIEYVFDTESTNTINLPDHRKLIIDPHIPAHARILLARGYEVGRALALNQGHLVMGEKIAFGATGETLDFHELTEKERVLLKTMARLGHLAQGGHIITNVYLYDNNQTGDNNTIEYTVLPLYVRQMLKNLDLVEKTDRKESIRANDDTLRARQTEMDPMEGTSKMYKENKSYTPNDNDTSDSDKAAYDSDKTISDSETDTDLETPVFKYPKRQLQKCNIKNENRVIEHLGRQYVCQFCEEPFLNENQWIVHFKICKEWKNKLERSEEEFHETDTESQRTLKQEENLKLAQMYEIFEEQIIDSRTQKGEKIYTHKQLNLITTVANIVAVTKRVMRHLEKEAIANRLLIQQYQIQKDRDDREIVNHRVTFINILNTLWTLDSILDKNKIIFINKMTKEQSRDKMILEWNQQKVGEDLTCNVCGNTFEDEQLTVLHKELVYCMHDGGLNNKVKKYLTREKKTRLENCQNDLGMRIDQISEAIKQYVTELNSEEEKERRSSMNTSTGSNRKRKYDKINK